MKNHKQFFKPSAVALVAGSLALAGESQAQNNTFSPGVSAVSPIASQIEVGPILDVVPYVLSDGYTINLTLIPSDTEFDGYDNPTTSGPPISNVTAGLNVVQLPIVLPTFTIRQVVTTVNVWDNQTVVLGGLISSSVTSTKDSVPFLGDIPLLGRLFQSESKQDIKKNLMIFVTATIVDPAGNRLHSGDELPFTQNAIPAQPEIDGQKFVPGPITGKTP